MFVFIRLRAPKEIDGESGFPHSRSRRAGCRFNSISSPSIPFPLSLLKPYSSTSSKYGSLNTLGVLINYPRHANTRCPCIHVHHLYIYTPFSVFNINIIRQVTKRHIQSTLHTHPLENNYLTMHTYIIHTYLHMYLHTLVVVF